MYGHINRYCLEIRLSLQCSPNNSAVLLLPDGKQVPCTACLIVLNLDENILIEKKSWCYFEIIDLKFIQSTICRCTFEIQRIRRSHMKSDEVSTIRIRNKKCWCEKLLINRSIVRRPDDRMEQRKNYNDYPLLILYGMRHISQWKQVWQRTYI